MYIGTQLTVLRHLYGYSIHYIAVKTKLSDEYIEKIERNEMEIQILALIKIAQFLQVTPNFLIKQQLCINNNGNVNNQFITYRTNSINTLTRQYYLSKVLVYITNYLFSFIKPMPLYFLEITYEMDMLMKKRNTNQTKNEGLKLVAQRAREKLLCKSSNKMLLLNLEKVGVIIYETQIKGIETFSFWSEDDMPYIILGNNKGVAVRRNFDIAHELGHLLLHRHVQFDLLTNEEHKVIENEANVFASEFLLPELEFREDFSKITKKSNPDHFKLLKEKWYVSIQAMGMRAYYLKLISSSQYRYFWSSINKKDYRKLEPLDEQIKISHPVKINSLLDLLFRKKVITPQDLLEDLKVEPEFLKEIANIDYKLFERYFKKEKTDKKVSLMNDFLNLDK